MVIEPWCVQKGWYPAIVATVVKEKRAEFLRGFGKHDNS